MINLTLETIAKSGTPNANDIVYSKEEFNKMIENQKEEIKNRSIKLTITPYPLYPLSINIVESGYIIATVKDIRDGEIDIEISEENINLLTEYINEGYKPGMRYICKSDKSSVKDIKLICYDMIYDYNYNSVRIAKDKIRGFEKIKSRENEDLIMPQAQTKNSAGYDFFVQEDITIRSNTLDFIKLLTRKMKKYPFKKGLTNFQEDSIKDILKPTIVKTGIKAYMQPDEDLDLYNRSSGPKKGLILANSVGIVDSDYYSNKDNDGEIGFLFYNILPWDITIKKGERIGQGIFRKFLKTDKDNRLINERASGTGSTDTAIKIDNNPINTSFTKEELGDMSVSDCIVRNYNYMTFKEAFEKMKSGEKVKLSSWSGYWTWENDTIMMHCREDQSDNGKSILDIRETQRVEYTINNLLTDKWVIADEKNCPLLGGTVIMDDEDAKKYIERGIKVKQITKNQWTFDE